MPPVTPGVINANALMLEHSVEEFEREWGQCDKYDIDSEGKDTTMAEFLRSHGELYLEDTIWGDGLVPLSKDYEEIYKLARESFQERLQGHITFKVSDLGQAFRCAEMFRKLGYCFNFEMNTIYDISYAVSADRKTCVMMLSFGTCSGPLPHFRARD